MAAAGIAVNTERRDIGGSMQTIAMPTNMVAVGVVGEWLRPTKCPRDSQHLRPICGVG
jgi:hypothetical protein